MFNRQKSFRLVITSIALVAVTAITFALTAGKFNFGTASTEAKTEKAAAPLTFGVCDTAGPLEVESSGGTAAGVPTAYATLSGVAGAFTVINAGVVHTGVITIDVCGNVDETTGVAGLNPGNVAPASWTSITMSPAGGAARTITGATPAGGPMIDLAGADNVTIDGLNTGGNSLTIANTTVSATSGTSTIRFIGGATNNIITNSNIQGSGTMSVATNGAVIFFSTDAVTASGNDSNIISNNNIGPAGANLPTKGILGNGSTTTTAIGNSGITITNNNIFDYFGAAVTSAGVATNGGCNTWSVTNNRFYQTGTRTWTTGALHNAINLANTTALSGAFGMTVTGNTIGYASNTQTGTYTLTGSTGLFRAIVFNGPTGGTISNINSNTIASISLTGVTSSGTGTSSPFMGMLISNGLVNTNSNTIGSQSATGSLTFSTTTTSAADVYGIYNFSFDDWTANNNNIGGISVTNLGAAGTFLIYVMRANTSTAKVFNATSNNIGGTVADSISLTATGAGAQVIGIATGNAISTWTSNTVRNMTTNFGTGTTTAASMIGLLTTTTSVAHTLSQNTIHTLQNTNATGPSIVTGIQYTGSAGANVVERNSIYNLLAPTTSTSAEINGIRVGGGTTVYRNNMIALGANQAIAIGSTATNTSTNGINGINDALSGSDSFFHNSVYIGGTATSGTGASYAFNSVITVNTRSFRDNIFFNARTNGGGTGSHYAVKINGAAPNPAGLTINNNIYFANGSGAVFGFFNALDVANLAAWKTAVGQDAASFEANPQYNDPTNAIPDLHIHPTNATAAEGNGADVGVVNDFDSQTRASFTPVDIGADAGNFNGVDLAPPAITYTPLGNTSLTTNRIQTVTITDVTGVATGGLSPRIYFNKNAGAYFSTACSLTGGTVNNGTWDCTIDNTLIGGVVATDVIRYFVVAQDTLGNYGSNPSGAGGTDVNTATPPAVPNMYTIVTGFAGSYNVGAAETVTSLTNAGGIFDLINAGALSANVTINITSDLAGETGAVALNQFAEDGLGGYTILIKPSGAPRTISGIAPIAVIRLNGADRVRIDGSTAAAFFEDGLKENGNVESVVGGTPALRELTVQNDSTSTTSAVIALNSGTNGAQNNAFQNVNVDGNSPTTTIVGISLGGAAPGTAGIDNDGNDVINCRVRRAFFGIYSAGAAPPNQNIGTRIEQNAVDSTGADRIRRGGILVFNEDGIQLIENSVGGIDNTGESADAFGIGVGTQFASEGAGSSGGIVNANVNRNRVSGVSQDNTFSAFGIGIAGGNTPAGLNNVVSNNMVTGVISDGNAGDLVAGIFVVGTPGSDTRLFYNSVAMTGDRSALLTPATSQLPSYGLAITGADPVVQLRNNIFYTSQTSDLAGNPGGLSFGIGMSSAAFTNLNSNFNDFFSTGARDGGFRTTSLGLTGGVNLMDLTAWTGATGDDASPDSMEADPLFVSPLSNLHLGTIFSPVYDQGVIVSVLDDHDAQIRSVVGFAGGVPDIGADEILAPSAAAVNIGGRVTEADGFNGLSKVNVTISGGNLTEPRNAITNPFGYYNFEDLQVGQTYILTVGSKRYTFMNPTIVVMAEDNITDANFFANP